MAPHHSHRRRKRVVRDGVDCRVGAAVACRPMSKPPATQYSITLGVTLDNVPGVLGRLGTAIGEAGGNIFAVEGFVAKGASSSATSWSTAATSSTSSEIVDAVEAVDGVTLDDWHDRTFRMHEGGKIEVLPLLPVGDQDDLSMAYTPVSPGSATRSPPTRRSPTSTRSARTPSRSSPTAPPCSASATSARRGRCR